MSRQPLAYAVKAPDLSWLRDVCKLYIDTAVDIPASPSDIAAIFSSIQRRFATATPLYVPFAELPPAARNPEV